jgi:hypothetical protein
MQGQQADVTFSGYKAIGGVQLPMQESLQADKGGYERTFTERSINTGLKPETFAKPKQ